MRKWIIYICLAVVAVVGIGFSYAKLSKDKNIICEQQYALCTSARCIPNPNNPDEATCFCEVLPGKSLGHTSCNKRIPRIDQMGIKRVTSTFSLAQFPSKKTMTCPSGKPWTDCLDQSCTVDPQDPSRAICLCKVVRTGEFQTMGGSCDTATCDTGYWSGATVEANSSNIQALIQALKLKQSPQRSCPK